MTSKLLSGFMNWCFNEKIKIYYELPIVLLTILVNVCIIFLSLYYSGINQMITKAVEYSANELSIFYMINIVIGFIIFIFILINFILSMKLSGFNWLFYEIFLILIFINIIYIIVFDSQVFLKYIDFELIFSLYLIFLIIHVLRFHKIMKSKRKLKQKTE